MARKQEARMSGDENLKETRLAAGQQFIDAIPHGKELGMTILSIGDGEAVMSVPYNPRLVGDPKTGVLHGGVVTTLLDSCCGAAVMCHPTNALGTATIDLRIDYMRPARPGEPVTAHATCFRATRNVAFVRAVAYDETEDDPVATASGSFTLERPTPKGVAK
jgi:uncharacterized protein (TIGR00369 family)